MLNPQEPSFLQPNNPLTSGLENSNLINPLKALGTIQGAWTPDLNVNLGNSGISSVNAPAIQLLDPSQIFVKQEIVNPAVANTYGLLGTNSCIVGDFSKSDILLSQKTREIIFVDSTVNNYQDLEGISENSEVVRLNANQDGVEQITGVLSHYQNIFSAVHIVSHGSVGSLQLGSTIFNDNSLPTYQFDLQKWSAALTKNADILLYGCDVSLGSAGHLFINDLANLTGADIAASSNLTGNSNLGGDWILEDKTGSIEASTLTASKDFNQVLGTFSIDSKGTLLYSYDNGLRNVLRTNDVGNNIRVSQVDNFLEVFDSNIIYTSYLFGRSNSAIQKTADPNTVKIDLNKISAIEIDTGNEGIDKVSVGALNFTKAINFSIKFGSSNESDESLIFGGTINLAGGNLTVKDADSVIFQGSQQFSTGGGSVTIANSDDVKIAGNLLLNGGDLNIAGAKTINILNQATISTRRIASSLPPDQLLSDNNSIGNSGNITLRGSDITIDANVKLLAQASGYQAGDISILAVNNNQGGTSTALNDLGLGLFGSTYKAAISLSQDTILKGQDIILNATATGISVDLGLSGTIIGNATASGTLKTIVNLAVGLPLATKNISAKANITVGSQSQIISSGNVSIKTNAVADSNISVASGDGTLKGYGSFLSVGLSIATTSSETILNDGVKIESARSVDILSDAKSTAATVSATKRNLGVEAKSADAIATSFALAYSNAISHATVNQNVAITAKGNINVRATGNSVNKTSATAGIYEDGTVGFTVAVGISESDIKSDVNGNLTAGAADVVKSLDLDSARTISSGSLIDLNGTISLVVDSIVFPTDHRLNTGDALVYTKGDDSSNQEIEGLKDGETYYVIVVDSKTIKLARTLKLAVEGKVELETSKKTGLAVVGRVIDGLDTSKKTGQGHKLVDGTKTNGIGIVAELESTDTAAASSGIVADTIANKVLNADKDALISAGRSSKYLKDAFAKSTGFFKTVTDTITGAGGSKNNQPTDWSAAGAFAYSSSDHRVTSQVGSNAKLLSEKDIDINAKHKSIVGVSASSTIDLDGDITDPKTNAVITPTKVKKTSVSASVGVSNYDSKVKALVKDGAQLDAKQKTNINAQTVYPFTFSTTFDYTKDTNEAEDRLSSLVKILADKETPKNLPWTSWTKSTAKAKNLGIAGTVNVMDFDNEVEANVGSGVLINQGTDSRYKSDSQIVRVAAKTDMTLVNITGNPISPTGNTEGSSGIGGSVFIENITNSTQALVNDGAKIATGSQGTFQLTALDDVNQFNLVYAGGSASNFGLSAAVAINLTNSTTKAKLSNLAQVSAGNVNITSLNDADYWNFVGGVIAGQGTGIGASIAINDITRDTQALIGSFSSPTRASTNTVSLTGGTLTISAKNDGNLVTASLAGAIQSDINTSKPAESNTSGSFGIGASGSVSINTIQDTTVAAIENANIIGSDRVTFGLPTPSKINISADNDSDIVAIGGAVSLNLKAKPSSGNALAGSFGKNKLKGMIRADISNSAVNLNGDVNLNATNNQTITSVGISGSIAASGYASLAGQVTINDTENETLAYVDRASKIEQVQNLKIFAKDESHIVAVSGVLSVSSKGGASAGVGASYASNDIRNTTKAYIDNANVNVNGSVGVIAVNDAQLDNIAVSAVAAKDGMALNLAYANNDIVNNTEAYISNSANITASGNASIDVVQTVGPTDIEKDKEIVNGVAVVAASTGEMDGVAITLAGVGKGLAGAANISDNEIKNTTKAYINLSTINSNRSVVVRALNVADTDIKAGAVSGAISGAAMGASLDMTDIKNETKSYIQSSTINAGSNVAVTSYTREQIDAVIVSGAISGSGLAVAGNVELLTLSSTNDAFIDRSTVNANGNLQVIADNIASIGENFNKYGKKSDSAFAVKALGVGSVGISVKGGGVGASVLLTNITNQTTARITDSTTNVILLTEVTANSAQVVSTLVGTIAGGAGFGIAGSLISNLVETKTRAYIDESNGGTTKINQNVAFDTQNVKVRATSNTDINSLAGGLSAGLAGGFGASGDINTISNITEAYIGDNIEVKAGGDVEVLADAKKSINSDAVAFGGGIIGLQGSICLVNIGVGVSKEGQDALSKDTATSLGDQVKSASNTTKRTTPISLSLVRIFNSSSGFQQYTKAYIGSNTVVDAGINIRVKATDETKLELDPGAASVGLLAAGGAFGIVNFNSDVQAFTGKVVTLDATASIEISAQSSVLPLNGSPMIETRALGGGIVAGAGSKANIESRNKAIAYIGNESSIGQNKALGSLQVNAKTESNLAVNASGVSGGLAAGGISLAKVQESGITQAYLGSNVRIGNTNRRIGDLSIQATSTENIKAESVALAGGIFAGAGSKSETLVTPSVYAYIDKGSNIFTNSDVLVNALVDGNVSTLARGFTVSVGNVGESTANTTWKPFVQAELRGEDIKIDAGGNVKIEAISNSPQINAQANASGGAVFAGISGATAATTIDSTVIAKTGDTATITAGNNIDINASTTNKIDVQTAGKQDSIFGSSGSSQSTGNVTNNTQASTGRDVKLRSKQGNISLLSVSDNNQNVKAVGSSKGALSNGGTIAADILNNNTLATLGNANSVVTENKSTGTLNIKSTSTIGVFSLGVQATSSLAATKIEATSQSTLNSRTDANIGDSCNIDVQNLNILSEVIPAPYLTTPALTGANASANLDADVNWNVASRAEARPISYASSNIGDNSRINARDVSLKSSQTIASQAFSFVKSDGIGPDAAFVTNRVDLQSKISTKPTVVIKTINFTPITEVKTLSIGGSYIAYAEDKDATGDGNMSYDKSYNVQEIKELNHITQVDLGNVLNADVIVNRNGGTTDTNQQAIDNSDYALITQSAASNAAGLSRTILGLLPDDGFFAANQYHPNIQLNYNNNNDGNNARLLKNQNESVTFDVINNQYNALHLALTSTNGTSGVKVKFNYTDGTFQDTESRNIPDWFGGIIETNDLYYLVDGLDRSKKNGSGFENSTDPAIFGSMWFLNKSRQLKSITLTKTSPTGNLVFFGASLTFDQPTIAANTNSAFNDDVIVNRSGDATDKTQSAIDNAGRALITQSFAQSRNPNGIGLPDDGFFAANQYHPNIQLSYNNNNNENNARLLKNQGDSVTFNVLSNQYNAVHLALTSTDNANGSDFKLKFNYNYGTPQETVSRNIPDWFKGIPNGENQDLYYLVDGLDLSKPDLNKLDGIDFQKINNPAIFGSMWFLDNSRKLESITLTKTSSVGTLVFLGASCTFDQPTFDSDVIVNGIGDASDKNQSPIDKAGFALVTQSFAKSQASSNGVGLPDNGFFAANQYRPDIQLSYNNNNDGNNARLLNTNESFTFNVSQNRYNAVHLALTSTDSSNGSSFKLRFNYADGTSKETKTESNKSIPDWSEKITETKDRYYLVNGMNRGQANGSSLDTNMETPTRSIFGSMWSLESKQLVSITITNISTEGKLVFLGATLTR